MKKTTKKITKKKKTTLEDVMSVISKWQEQNDTCFCGSFVSFDEDAKNEDDCIKEDRMIAYGGKKTIKIGLDELVKMIKEDKDEFINW